MKKIDRYNFKKAFTMIELVFVIVVMGILAALAIPRLERDIRQEAMSNILSAIRYTKHLALVDDKRDPRDNNWQKKLWHIRFAQYTNSDNKTRWFYTISTDDDKNSNVDKKETAIDTATGKYIYHLAGSSTINSDESPMIFIGKKYGVDTVSFSGGCANVQHVAFDNLGRPHVGIYGATNDSHTYMSSDCLITIGFEKNGIDDINITVEKQTGRVFAN